MHSIQQVKLPDHSWVSQKACIVDASYCTVFKLQLSQNTTPSGVNEILVVFFPLVVPPLSPVTELETDDIIEMHPTSSSATLPASSFGFGRVEVETSDVMPTANNGGIANTGLVNLDCVYICIAVIVCLLLAVGTVFASARYMKHRRSNESLEKPPVAGNTTVTPGKIPLPDIHTWSANCPMEARAYINPAPCPAQQTYNECRGKEHDLPGAETLYRPLPSAQKAVDQWEYQSSNRYCTPCDTYIVPDDSIIVWL